MAEEGDSAPDFSLMGDDGREHSLREFRGKAVVLYFYPKDDTPGCTIEAKEFTRELGGFRKAGAVVIGVSDDGFDSHCRFRDKYSLKVLLLSDPEGGAIRAYGAYGNKGAFGRGTIRKTFVISASGTIVKIYPKVSAPGHAKEVLDYVGSMR